MKKTIRSVFPAILLIGIATTIMSQALAKLPIDATQIAIDWKQIWSATHGFTANFGSSGLFNPPWILPLIWPFTLFAFEISWGLAAIGTLTVLFVSVPKTGSKNRWIAAVFILAISYPSLRQIVDGNLEAVVILGFLVVLKALEDRNELLLAIGFLLSTGKIQSSWLFIIGVSIWLYREWPRVKILRAIGWVAALALPFLYWRGEAWLRAFTQVSPGQLPSWVSSSLNASLARHMIPKPFIWFSWLVLFLVVLKTILSQDWEFSRNQLGMLSSASLLLAPYSASNSVLSPFALGVIPLWMDNPKVGGFLFILYNLPYLVTTNPAIRITWESSYWTGVLLITWVMTLQTKITPDS
jgi:hypothetical protein